MGRRAIAPIVGVTLVCALVGSASASATGTRVVSRAQVSPTLVRDVPVEFLAHGSPGRGVARSASGIAGVDSVQSFTGTYQLANYDSFGNPNSQWTYNTLGRQPHAGGTTTVRAPIVPVVVELLNVDGTVAMTSDPNQQVRQALTSPVFAHQKYSSSRTPTQYADAIQRAQFYRSAEPDWHTMLAPVVAHRRVMRVPYGSYRYALNPDGSLRYTLVDLTTFDRLLFPSTSTDTSTVIGAAEHAGEMTTKDITTVLFNNVLLADNLDSPSFVVLGYHSYDIEPGDAGNGHRERDYVMNYASWLSPGLFDQFVDVTPLSHEIAEIFNDPFAASQPSGSAVPYDTTPWWRAPNGTCQNILEVGDVLEGLPYSTYATTIHGRTYHPQNEALLQWFEARTPSDAIGGAYSYPDTTLLTTPNTPQPPGCP
jgi:hypothetical protein